MTQHLEINLYHYLILAIIIFFIGFLGVILSKNLIKTLISIEIILNAVSINFVAIANYTDGVNLSGMIFSIFIMIISAIHLALGLAILILLFKYRKSININDYSNLRG